MLLPLFLTLLLHQGYKRVKEKGWDEVFYFLTASLTATRAKQMKAKLPAASQLHSDLSKPDILVIKAKSNFWLQSRDSEH